MKDFREFAKNLGKKETQPTTKKKIPLESPAKGKEREAPPKKGTSDWVVIDSGEHEKSARDYVNFRKKQSERLKNLGR